MKTHYIKSEVFPAHIWVVIGKDLDKVTAFIKKTLDAEVIPEIGTAGARLFYNEYGEKDFGVEFILWFREKPSPQNNYNLLYHELNHLTNRILVGLEIEVKPGDEVSSYYGQWLCLQVLQALRKK